MRATQFGHNEHYHICSRGLDRQILFKDNTDWARFLFLILHFQSPIPLYNISHSISSYLKRGRFGIGEDKKNELTKKKTLELLSFAIMPNHFHLLLHNISDGAVSVYMQRVLMAYGKYFNTKYERFGHVFDGPFRSIRIKNNEQLLHTASYIHKNPMSLPEYEHRYDEYPYSSYQDYLNENRWQNFLKREAILDQFKNPAGLRHFTETSTAKEKELFFDF